MVKIHLVEEAYFEIKFEVDLKEKSPVGKSL